MSQDMESSPYNPKKVLLKMPYRFTRSDQLLVHSSICVRCDWFPSTGSSKESAMNGTSGFQEERSSTSRSPWSRLLHEQRHRFGTGACRLLRTHNLIALSKRISTKRENHSYLTPFLFFQTQRSKVSVPENIQFGRKD